MQFGKVKNILGIKERSLSFAIFAVILLVLLGIFVFRGSDRDFATSDIDCVGCNVILISIDTLGAEHLGLYGYDVPTSPFLDKISGERGIVFNNAIAQASWTLPSHAAMLTSLYPEEMGIWLSTDALPQEAKTIAEVLKENNFITQAFSNGLLTLSYNPRPK